jgi:hypothetical protein
MIYDIEYETMPREALEAIQFRRLKATIDRGYASVPFYRKKFEEAGLTPGDSSVCKICRNCRSPPSRISETIILLACLPFPWKTSCVFTPLPVRPGNPPWWGTRRGTWTPGPVSWPDR